MPRPPAVDEVEAKLLAPDAATLDAIAALETIGGYRLMARDAASLKTTYLDSADQRLLEHRVALRVRRKHDGWQMTAKWSGSVSDDVHVRREINVDLESPPGPDYEIPPGPLRDQIVPLLGDRPLRPLVVTAIERRTADVLDSRGTVVAELALDTVQHSDPKSTKRCEPYFEVEVELRRGPVALVSDIAGLLKAAFPLETTRESKFSRALKQVLGPRTPKAAGADR
jgi:inorganic triphosphatase YgiF